MYKQSSLPIAVSDGRANKNELIIHAVEAIGKSKQRLKVFKAIYYHKKRVKSVSEIVEKTGLQRKRVLEEGKRLVHEQVVGQTKNDDGVAYVQEPFYQVHKRQILNLIEKPNKKEKLPTKRTPKVAVTINDKSNRKLKEAKVRFLTIDEIDSFHAVRGTAPVPYSQPLSEEQFKRGIQRIMDEQGQFKDWGGEKNDIFTTRLLINRKRHPTAIALKGPGQKGILKPKLMGTNGDQIQRLFQSPANVFLIQYHGQIDQSVIEQMEAFAHFRAKSQTDVIYFGVIDGQDTRRLIAAYPTAFLK